MKTFNSVLAVMAIALLLSAASVLQAGPPPDLQNRMRPTVAKPAPTAPAATCGQAGQVWQQLPELRRLPRPGREESHFLTRGRNECLHPSAPGSRRVFCHPLGDQRPARRQRG